MNLDIQKYKKILEAKLEGLEKEVAEISSKESDGTREGIQTEINEDTADGGEVATSMENYELNKSIASSLEEELIQVRDALDKIEAGTYGVCEVCQAEIEEDRLDANPEAKTCKLHIESI